VLEENILKDRDLFSMSVLGSLTRSISELKSMQDHLNQQFRNSRAIIKDRVQKAKQVHESYVRLESRTREVRSRKLAEIQSLRTKDKVFCTQIAAKMANMYALEKEVQCMHLKIEQQQKLLSSMATTTTTTTTNDRRMEAEQVTLKWDHLYTKIV